MRKLLTCVLLLMAIGCNQPETVEPEATGEGEGSKSDVMVANEGTIIRHDPAADSILPADAKLEQLAVRERFGILEGPVWVPEGPSGYLLFSDIPTNVIYKWTPDDVVSVFLEKSGYTGNDILNVGQISISGRIHVAQVGSNGLTLDPQGRLVICAQSDRALVRIEKDGTRTILADRYEGKRINGPNDVAVRSDGALYFSDGLVGLRGRERNPARELSFNGLYLVKDGKVQLLDPGRFNSLQIGANGITFSPDEKYLYVSAGPQVLRYDVQPDGTITNGRVFIEDGSDGMRVDQEGNLYTTRNGRGVWITAPDGKHLATIDPPKVVGFGTTNVAFGDTDYKTLYITARTTLHRIRVNIPGDRIGPTS